MKLLPVTVAALLAGACNERRRDAEPVPAARVVALPDVASPERGRLLPTVARTMVADDYLPENVLAVAPRPGFILAPKRTYAFVVLRQAGDAAGKPLAVAPALRDLAAGRTPSGRDGGAAKMHYQALFATPSSGNRQPDIPAWSSSW